MFAPLKNGVTPANRPLSNPLTGGGVRAPFSARTIHEDPCFQTEDWRDLAQTLWYIRLQNLI